MNNSKTKTMNNSNKVLYSNQTIKKLSKYKLYIVYYYVQKSTCIICRRTLNVSTWHISLRYASCHLQALPSFPDAAGLPFSLPPPFVPPALLFV